MSSGFSPIGHEGKTLAPPASSTLLQDELKDESDMTLAFPTVAQSWLELRSTSQVKNEFPPSEC